MSKPQRRLLKRDDAALAVQGDRIAQDGGDPPAPAITLDVAIATTKAALAAYQAAEDARAPLRERASDLRRWPTKDEELMAMKAVPVPLILFKPTTWEDMVQITWRQKDGTERVQRFDENPVFGLTEMRSKEEIEQHYADQPEKLKEALRAFDRFHKEAWGACTRLQESYKTDEWRAADKIASEAGAKMRAARDVLDKARAALIDTPALTRKDKMRKIRLVLETYGASITRRGYISGFEALENYDWRQRDRVLKMFIDAINCEPGPPPANEVTSAAEMPAADAWAAFKQWMAWAHPLGAQVVDRAHAAGCRLDQCIGVNLDGPRNVMGGHPIAYFGEWSGEYLVVQPHGVSRYRPAPRGTGPEIDLTDTPRRA